MAQRITRSDQMEELERRVAGVLGIDTAHVTDMHMTGRSGEDYVRVMVDSAHKMPLSQFEQILAAVRKDHP